MSLKTFLRKQAAQHLILEQKKPQLIKDLVFVGVDSEGKKYYSWEKLENIPRNRYIAIEQTNMYIDNKISPANLSSLSLAIIEVNQALIRENDPKKIALLHAQIDALASELTFRQKYAIPSQVLVALASIVTIREDEDPSVYSETIQTEKSETFAREMNIGNCFFLTSPIFKALIPSLLMSNEEWTIHLGSLALQEEHVKERLKTILSKSKSEATEKAKTA